MTEQKHAEKALQEREEQIRHTVENAPLGIGKLDLNDTFRSVNQAYCEMLGYCHDELLTMTSNDITILMIEISASVYLWN